VASERLDYDDAYTRRFTARVAAAGAHAGRAAVELEATYFFPEGGGQEADRGRLGAAAVVDVQSGDDGRVWHVVDGPLPEPGADHEAELDWARRFDHMQQHTGQHVLSAAFERELGLATLSSHLGEERSSLELDARDADWRAVERAERAANAVVWDDRPIRRHWVTDDEVGRFALRKPPKFTGRIRIVEVPDWDVSACGGTHTARTGEVGVIKIVRWEKVRGNVRFEFLCGGRALRDYGWRTESLIEAARRRTLKDTELLAHLERAASERDSLRKQLRELSDRLIATEAAARVGDPPRPVAEHRERMSREDARGFALQCLAIGAPWVAVAAAEPDAVLVVGRAKSGGPDLRAMVPSLLERARGKGGGSPDLVQIAAADAAGARAAFDEAVAALSAATGRTVA
jgi:alanyl-tRNA synthetase